MIPPLTDAGHLPVGIHDCTLEEIRRRFGRTTDTRRRLMKGLEAIVKRARRAGAKHFYLDGSFVTQKSEPGDWDGVLVMPVGWNAAGAWAAFFTDRERIKKDYGGDLFTVMEDDGEVLDHYVREVFATDREGRKKGLLRIRLKGEEKDDGPDQE